MRVKTQQKVSKGYWQRKFRENLMITVVWAIAFLSIPIASVWDLSLLLIGSVLYQIVGVALLYTDERYKMRRDTLIFGKSNSIARNILMAPSRMYEAFQRLNPPEKKSKSNKKITGWTFDIKVTPINYDYDEIEDEEERRKEQLQVIESDLMSIRYFSLLRKLGYLILASGFVLQFIHTMVSQ